MVIAILRSFCSVEADENCDVIFIGPFLYEQIQILQSFWSKNFPLCFPTWVVIIESHNPIAYRHSNSIQACPSNLRYISLLNPCSSMLFKSNVSNRMPKKLHSLELTFIGNISWHSSPYYRIFSHPMLSNKPSTKIYPTHWNLSSPYFILNMFCLYLPH